MKKLIIIPLILMVIGCKTVQPLKCEEPLYIKGRLLLAKYTGHDTRIVLYKTKAGEIVVSDVPMDVQLDSIPVCIQYSKFIYFKKT